MTKSFQVSIARGESGEGTVREAMELLGGMEQVVDTGDKVLIKPNNVIQRYVRGTVTSAEVVAALALLVREAGGKPIVGESDLVYDPSSPGFDTSCGKHYLDTLAQMGLAEEVPLVDLMKDEMIRVEIPDARIFRRTKIARTALEVDKIIDVPVLKTHDQTRVTLGIKNLEGVIPMSEKKRSHATSVEQAIVDLCSFLKPSLVVVDGLIGAEGMGPTGGDPVKMDLIIAGANPLATDMVGASVIGLDIEQIKYLQYGVMPEPANLLFAGEQWSADLLAPLKGRIYGCNAQSIALDPSGDAHVEMNDGRQVPYSRLDWPDNTELDLPGFVAALQAAGYDDFINFIDPFHPDMTVQELATSTAAYGRQVVGS